MISREIVLVTGAGGFIGANLTKKLVDLGNKVHVLTTKKGNPWRLQAVRHKITTHQDFSQVAKIKPSYIFHLASYGAYSHQQDLSEMIKVNISLLVNLLHSLEGVSYKAFINTGTSSEYGFKKVPMRETHLLKPTSFYAATKASGTLLSQVFSQSSGHNIITLRPFSVYGPWEEPTRLVPTLISRALADNPLEITDNQARHDFIYIADLIEAYLKAATTPNLKGEIFNIGTGIQHSNQEVAKMVKELTKSKSKILTGAYQPRVWDSTFWVADNTKAKKMLKWQPKITLSSGLKKTIAWLKQNQNHYD